MGAAIGGGKIKQLIMTELNTKAKHILFVLFWVLGQGNFVIYKNEFEECLRNNGKKMIKINIEIFEKYIENKADWKVQIGMHLTMCINHGQKGVSENLLV